MGTIIEEVQIVIDRNGNRIGYAEAVLKTEDGLMIRLNGMVIYQNEGKLYLSYPRRDKKKDISYWNPVNTEAGKLLEEAVFGELLLIKNIKFD
jgi:hypothetical protein